MEKVKLRRQDSAASVGTGRSARLPDGQGTPHRHAEVGTGAWVKNIPWISVSRSQ